jgi:autotransporter-associated beta strand protein
VNSLVIVNGSANGGGQLYTNTAVSISNNVQLSGVGRAESGGSYGAFRMKGGTMSGNVALIGNARIGGNNDYTISGQISGPFEAEFDMGNANSATGNTLTLSNTSNSYSGGTRISRGTLSLGVAGALPANTLLTFGSTQPTGSVGVESTATPILNLNSNAGSVSGIATQSGDSTATAATITSPVTGPVTTLTINNGDDFTFGGTIINSVAITKNGAGRQTFSGSNNYGGATNINAGVLSVTGTISTSPTNVNTSGSSASTLAGTGRLAAVTLAANNGASRARVTPGATSRAGDIGTLTMSSLSVGGGNLVFDLGATATSSDSINVTGTATFNGAATITPIGAAGAASYTLLSATSLTLNTLPTLELVAGSPTGYSLDFGTANTIRLVNTLVPVTLFWTGATDNQWDIGATQNWTDTNVAATFANGNIVDFVNGALNQNIAINSTVQPAAINVTNDIANAYTFSGAGTISSSNGTLTKNGSGVLTITNSGSNQFARTNVNGGTVVFANQNSLGTLTIAGGTARISAHAANNDPAFVTIVPDLSITPGTLDLNNNAMIVDYTGASPLQSIRAALTSGFAGGSWNGIGIDSSSASIDPTHKSALGYAEASTLGVGSFAGHALADNSAILLRYTLSGDANLDGLVNAIDFNALATNFGAAGTTLWTQGDFNFDGQINSLDFNSLASNVNGTLPSPAVGLAAVVPEPLGFFGAVPLLLFCLIARVGLRT